MATDLPPTAPSAAGQAIASTAAGGELIESADLARAVAYARARHAPATRRAYRADFAIFSRWAKSHNLSPLPADPDAVAAFLAAEGDAGRRPATITRRLAAIAHVHLLEGHPPPSLSERVRATMSGIRRVKGARTEPKAPATLDIIEKLAQACGTDLRGLRDRAVILLGFAAALRRSELATLDMDHLTFVDEGLRVFLPVSKTDQEGRGEEVAVLKGQRLCPIAALKAWLKAAQITHGAVFRAVWPDGRVDVMPLSDRSIALIVQRRAMQAVGYKATIWMRPRIASSDNVPERRARCLT
jgi:site-specific recombinase XerD